MSEWTERDLRRALAPETRGLFLTWLAYRLDPADFAKIEHLLRAIVVWDDADPEENHLVQ